MKFKQHIPASFRILMLFLLLILQIAALISAFHFLQNSFAYFYGICELISLLVVLHIINADTNPNYKIPWIILNLTFPICGGLFYLIFGRVHFTKSELQRSQEIYKFCQAATANPNQTHHLEQLPSNLAIQSHYISNNAIAPIYTKTHVEFLPLGENMLEKMLVELRQAKKFIFLEYFIIAPGKMWDSILTVLLEKAQAGLDIRVIYDDIGSLGRIPHHYDAYLRSHGIDCLVFNPFNNVFSSRLNNRDHRKLCIIDGNVGFTGGINLADEYINELSRFGHWKDSAVMLKGEAVRSMTAMFLALWDFTRNIQEDFNPFIPSVPVSGQGYVQPFFDSPADSKHVSETVYQNMIHRAQRYVYIMTPYLIIDNEMISALTHAAQSGIDVRIMMPGIPDKKIIFLLSRSYYKVLLEAGVRIYEYTPGFLHAKEIFSDDCCAVVGTINLDYRSFCHHYECGVWMCDTPAIENIKADYLHTLNQCQEITLEYCRKYFRHDALLLPILRLFSPLF